MRSPQRRDLLGLLAGGATATLAGCLSELNDASTEGTETDDEDDAGAGTGGGEPLGMVRTWIPHPSVVGDRESFTFYLDASVVASEALSDSATERLVRLFVGVPTDVLALSEIDETVSFGGGSPGVVATYAVETAELRERLAAAAEEGDPRATPTATSAGTEVEDDGTVAASADENTDGGDDGDEDGDGGTGDGEDSGEYESYATPNGHYRLADDHVLFAAEERLLDQMRATAAGDSDSYARASDFDAVLDAVGDVDAFAGKLGQHEVVDSTAFGYSWTFESDVSLTAPFVYDDEPAVDTGELDELAERAGFAEYENVETAVDGRVATLSGSIPTSEFDVLERDDGGKEETSEEAVVPQVSLEVAYEQGGDGEWNGEGDERIEITHHGGESADVDQLSVRYGDVDVSEIPEIESVPPEGDWQAGGTWTLRSTTDAGAFESGDDLTVIWLSPSDDSSVIILDSDVP